MHRSPLEIDHVQEYEEIASFGGAVLLKDLLGRLKIVGGTEDDRTRAQKWVEMFFGQQKPVRWR